MEQNKWTLFGIGLILMNVLVLLCLLFILDQSIGTNQSLEGRVKWLENKMIEHTKPVIQISRGTVYNTEGQIVLETHDDNKTK